jgi:DNA-directed RNA polymerase specialized sigma24 family protein
MHSLDSKRITMKPFQQQCTSEAFQKMLDNYPKKGLDAFTPLIIAERNWVFTTAYAMLKNKADAEEVRNESLVCWVRRLAVSKDYQKVNRAYLHTIVQNKVFDFFKKQKLKIEAYEPAIDDIRTETDTDTDLWETKLDRINKGFDELPEPCKSMLLMNLNPNLTQRAIVQELNLNYAEAAITGVFRNCRNTLRAIIFEKFKINING